MEPSGKVLRVAAISSKCCCVHVAWSNEQGWRIPEPDPRCLSDHERKSDEQKGGQQEEGPDDLPQ